MAIMKRIFFTASIIFFTGKAEDLLRAGKREGGVETSPRINPQTH
jgi:hypothetical protein